MTSIQAMSAWSAGTFPLPTTTTTLTSIDSTHSAGLMSTLVSAASALPTATVTDEFVSYSQMVRGAKASLAVISAEEVLQTATATDVQSQATDIIYDNTLNLIDLWWEQNVYEYRINVPPNIVWLAVFGLLSLYLIAMTVVARYEWFNIAFVCGYLLELIGYIFKALSFDDMTNDDFYLGQFVCLTIAPAFIMAGIYFLYAQTLVIHGRQYSFLKPLWYSYIFISWDVTSLVIQAIGGGIASSANDTDTSDIGVNILIAGVCIQIAGMTVFLVLLISSLNLLYFKNTKLIQSNSPLNKWSIWNFIKFLVNTKSADRFKRTELDRYYNQAPIFMSIRQKSKLLPYFPFAILVSVIFVYVRCVFRVVELCQGWHGYLMVHEIYTLLLDSFPVAVCGLIYVPFHPVWVFGRKNIISSKAIRKNIDEKQDEKLESIDDSASTFA